MKKFIFVFLFCIFCTATAYAHEMPPHSNVVEYEETINGITFTFYEGDFLVIKGQGVMPECNTYWGNVDTCFIEEGITVIEGDALTTEEIRVLYLPDSLTRLESYAFSNAPMQEIYFSNNLEFIGSHAFDYSGEELILPNSLRQVDNGAFDCNHIRKISYHGNNLLQIGRVAFFASMVTEEVDFTGPVQIENSAFATCVELKNVTLGEGTTTIGEKAFYRCRNLKTLTLPSTLTEINTDAFSGTPVSDIYYYGTQEDWNKIQIADGNYSVLQATIHYLGKPAPKIGVTVNGKALTFDQPPVLMNDRTLVPLRAIFTELGAEILWDDATKTVTATNGDTVIVMQIDNATYTVNGEAKTLDVPAQLINDRTLIPVRAVAESFNCSVNWIEDLKIVEIKK